MIPDDTLLSILETTQKGLTCPKVQEILLDKYNDVEILGGIPKHLSNLHMDRVIYALKTKVDNHTVYVHPKYKHFYKECDFKYKKPKVNEWEEMSHRLFKVASNLHHVMTADTIAINAWETALEDFLLIKSDYEKIEHER